MNSEPKGVLPRTTDQSEDQDVGASAGSIEKGAGDDKGLTAEEEILTGSYRWCGWDTAGPAEGQRGTAWRAEVHHEGSCLDATWGSGVEFRRPVLSEAGLAADGSIGGPKPPGATPHTTTPPPSQSNPLDRCGPGELGGGTCKKTVGKANMFHHPFSHNQR